MLFSCHKIADMRQSTVLECAIVDAVQWPIQFAKETTH